MERYRIIKKIGSGTFGDVFTAEDIVTLETVAIKIIKRQTSSLQSCLKLREIQALIKLEHPNLMALKGLYHCKGRLWIVCEYA
jgi:serine/threonine protein kinase